MELLRAKERKIIRHTSNTYRLKNSFKYINNTKLYEKAKIDRIDIQLCMLNIKFHEACANNEKNHIKNIVKTNNSNVNVKYKNTDYLHYLNNTNELYENDKLTLFHRAKYKTGLVYNTNQ